MGNHVEHRRSSRSSFFFFFFTLLLKYHWPESNFHWLKWKLTSRGHGVSGLLYGLSLNVSGICIYISLCIWEIPVGSKGGIVRKKVTQSWLLEAAVIV